jgi:hypothetical protein
VGIGVTSLASARAEPRSVRETKGGGVNFHLASTTPINGYDKVSPGGDSGTLYVAPRAVWTGKEVVSARTTDSRDGSVMELTLSAEAAERLATQRKHQSGDRVAIYVDGKLMSTGILGAVSTGGRATITGLTSANTESVVRLLNGERPIPVPMPTTISALISVVPVGQSDGAYLVDVFVQGVTNLRTYQIGLITSGGQVGELVREEVEIQASRPDFVFSELDTISAADQVGGRLSGVLVDGGVDKATPAYLGTYAFRPSPGATGTFEVAIDTGVKSFLADGQNEMVEFRTGPAALISIGGVPTRPVIDK